MYVVGRPGIQVIHRRLSCPGVSYRDENETLRARVGELEQKLAGAEDTIARLRGESSDARRDDLPASLLVGEPLGIHREGELPHEITEQGFEAIAALLQSRLGLRASQVGRTLEVPGVFSLTSRDGVTRIRLSADWTMLRGAVTSGPVLVTLFGTLPLVAALLDVTHDPATVALHAAWIMPLAILSAGLGMRRVARRRAREKLAAHEGAFQAVLDLAAAHAVRDGASIAEQPAVKARVATDASEPDAGEESASARAARVSG